MNCKNCGAEITASQKFCQSCGSKVEIETVNTTENQNPVREVQSTNSNNNNQKSTFVETGKGFKIASLVLGIISLVFCILNVLILPLAIIGLVLGIVYNVKNKKTPAGLVINIIAIVLSIIIFIAGIALISFIGTKFEEAGGIDGIEDFFNKIEDRIEEKLEDYEPDFSFIDDEFDKRDKYSGYKYVGSDEYGYIKVPNNWGKFYDVEGTDALQYSYGQTWIVTLYSTDNMESKYKYANLVYGQLKSENVEDLNMKFDFIGDEMIISYKVSCYYPDEDKYFSSWFFEDDEKERVYYVAIEGPDEDSEYFDLIDTFIFEK